jgi:hypothetical protein
MTSMHFFIKVHINNQSTLYRAADYEMTPMHFFIKIHINNQSTLYMVNNVLYVILQFSFTIFLLTLKGPII